MSAPQAPATLRPRAVVLLAILASVAALHLGRDILAPLALAGLLAFLLTPVASRIERLPVSRGVAAVASVLFLMAIVAGPLYLVLKEGVALSRELPAYRENLRNKLDTLQGVTFTEPLRAATEPTPEDTPPGEAAAPTPTPVRVVERPRGAVESLAAILGPIAPLGAGLVIVLVLTTVLLASRADLRERFVQLVSRGELAVTTQALDEASAKVSRFLAGSLLVNLIFAVPVTLGMFAIGVPNALLWGFLAGVLRFVPIVGVWIAALFPLATVFAVYDDWWRTGAILAIFGVIDLIVANVAEPLIFGRRTGIAPFAVVLCTFFWTWLWGAPGLLLAMPLTVCLAVAGRYVPGLAFLEVLLGASPALSPAQRFYQSLLMFDPKSARTQLEEAVKQEGLDPTLDKVVLPALAMASADRRRGVLEQAAFQDLCESARDLVDESASDPAAAPPVATKSARPALLVPVADAADSAATDMLAARLATLGISSEIAPASALGGEIAGLVERLDPPLVVLVGLPPLADVRMRYLAKRLRGIVPAGQLLSLAWQVAETDGEAQRGLSEATDLAIHDMTHATLRIRSLFEESLQRVDPPARPAEDAEDDGDEPRSPSP